MRTTLIVKQGRKFKSKEEVKQAFFDGEEFIACMPHDNESIRSINNGVSFEPNDSVKIFWKDGRSLKTCEIWCDKWEVSKGLLENAIKFFKKYGRDDLIEQAKECYKSGDDRKLRQLCEDLKRKHNNGSAL